MAATPRKESSGTLNGFLAEMLNDLNNLVLDVPALPELPAEPSVPAAAAAAAAVPPLPPRKGMQRSPSMSSVRELLERCDSSFLNTSSPDDLGELPDRDPPVPEAFGSNGPPTLRRGDKARVLLCMHDWYCPTLSRQAVDGYLRPGADGAFIVRHSLTQKDCMALCVKFGTIVLHFLLQRVDQKGRPGCVQLQGGGLCFTSLVSLVAFHTQNRGCLPCVLALSKATLEAHGDMDPLVVSPPSPLINQPRAYRRRLSQHSDTRQDRPPVEADDGQRQRSITVIGAPEEPREVRDVRAESASSGGSAAPPAAESAAAEVAAASSSDDIGGLGPETMPHGEFVASSADRRKSRFMASMRHNINKVLRPRKKDVYPAQRIAAYLQKVLHSRGTTEYRTVANFISCTKESDEPDPTVVMRNIRQFMDGMRHFINAQHGHQMQHVLRKCARISEIPLADILDSVNIEAVIEGVMQSEVVQPLRSHVFRLLQAYDPDNALKLDQMEANMATFSGATEVFGMSSEYRGLAWEPAVACLAGLPRCDTAVEKLRTLLLGVSKIHEIVQTGLGATALSADDFLPLFIYVLVHTRMHMVELEASFMWGLLDPGLLLGEGGYYLTTMSSAVHVIKRLHLVSDPQLTQATRLPCMEDIQGFIRVYFPKHEGSMLFKTIPVKTTTTAAETIRQIEEKFNLETRGQAPYHLFEVRPGKTRKLDPTECPWAVKAKFPPDRGTMEYYFEYRQV